MKLPQVTLFAIDCFKPWRTIHAMRSAMRFVRFGDAVLLTDTKQFDLGASDIRISDHRESHVKVACPRPDHYPLPRDYEIASLREPSNPDHRVETSHILYMEWDSGIANPWAWLNSWLEYDYIGAPWPPHCEAGWPACDETNNVGNAGFSLRSMRYCRGTAAALIEFQNDPMVKAGVISSDMHPCRTWRKWLETVHGVRFAPDTVAGRFSCENMIYSGQFGWHGRWTGELNGWGGELADVRPSQDHK